MGKFVLSLSEREKKELLVALNEKRLFIVSEKNHIRMNSDGTAETIVDSGFHGAKINCPVIGELYTGSENWFAQGKPLVEGDFKNAYKKSGATLNLGKYCVYFTDEQSEYGQILTGRPANNPKGNFVVFYGEGEIAVGGKVYKDQQSAVVSRGVISYRQNDANGVADNVRHNPSLRGTFVSAFESCVNEIVTQQTVATR